ncbi:MAG: carboxylating nicotinate-nucleotide diphosphorylase [Nitrospirae bacterium]|nr:carboxylating nicotinate-nucleotide diphosphorylase [Nitrospirota bacterium]
MNTFDIQEIIARALAEDIGNGDVTTEATVDPDKDGEAVVVAKEDFILAGYEVFLNVFMSLEPGIEFNVEYLDGDEVEKGANIITLKGPMRTLLTSERVALNLLQRMSGIATLTAKYVKAIEGTKAAILDTRKTTPGLRTLEKYAVTVGGGRNHRFGLYDGILIKDNHIAAAGGITKAVEAARATAPHMLKIEVECESVKDVKEALKAGADVIMLDNMDEKSMAEAVKVIGGKALTEASGNMTLERVRAVAGTGVDFISVGALTHSAPAVDISMRVKG